MHSEDLTVSDGPMIFTGSRTHGRSEMTTDTPLYSVASRNVRYIVPMS